MYTEKLWSGHKIIENSELVLKKSSCEHLLCILENKRSVVYWDIADAKTLKVDERDGSGRTLSEFLFFT